jgi:hypothetical protein
VVAEAIAPDILERRPFDYDDDGDDQFETAATESYSEEEAEEVQRRLRGLGYVE